MRESEDLLTVDELAKRLKIKKSWVYAQTRRRDADSIPKLKIGKYLRFEWEAVRNWIDNQNQKESI